MPAPPSGNSGFLAVPPFPGARVSELAGSGECSLPGPELVNLVRELRVGGEYWGAQPSLPPGALLSRDPGFRDYATALGPVVRWPIGMCDPWHTLERASGLICDEQDPVRAIAAILGIPTYDRSLARRTDNPRQLIAGRLHPRYRSPFGGEWLGTADAIRLAGHWRSLIDSNRGIGAALGFAFWKQENVGALLWSGGEPVRFVTSVPHGLSGQAVALWRTRTPAAALRELDRQDCVVIEVEDGFLRSQGLGADCVPPLSITVDRLGPYFDPAQPSELENLLQNGPFSTDLLRRARDLRTTVVAAGLGKYEAGVEALDRPAGERRHVLVPGQVEDDRSIMTGGCGLHSNLELLRRVREREPAAFILYKPHPDVLAGHRKGAIAEVECLRYADTITTDDPIASLLDMVDEVQVNTSLTGFEALMREKSVVTHGVPFYAGWGLTTDLGPVPARRTARRSLDELVAATLLLYPRYIDPESGLPCPAEVVVARLKERRSGSGSVVVRVRRLQGKLMRRLRGWMS